MGLYGILHKVHLLFGKRVLDKHHLDISITQEKVASLMGKTMEEIGNILFPSVNEEKEIKLLMILVKKRSII